MMQTASTSLERASPARTRLFPTRAIVTLATVVACLAGAGGGVVQSAEASTLPFFVPNGGCKVEMTYDQASAMCASQNGRLPTQQEMMNADIPNLGCGVSKTRVWTSTGCINDKDKTQPAFVITFGNGPNPSLPNRGILCALAKNQKAVICIAGGASQSGTPTPSPVASPIPVIVPTASAPPTTAEYEGSGTVTTAPTTTGSEYEGGGTTTAAPTGAPTSATPTTPTPTVAPTLAPTTVAPSTAPPTNAPTAAQTLAPVPPGQGSGSPTRAPSAASPLTSLSTVSAAITIIAAVFGLNA